MFPKILFPIMLYPKLKGCCLKIVRVVCAWTLIGAPLSADWPSFLGPTADLHAPAIGTGTPSEIWSAPAGEGFSGPVVANGVIYIYERSNKEEIVRALSAATGKPIWKQSWTAVYEDGFGRGDGPRGTPVCHKGLVIVMGPEGTIRALAADSGKLAWKWENPGGRPPRDAFFGYGFSPAIIGDKLWINPGVEGAGIVALDPLTGAELHKLPNHKAGYSTPIPWDSEGKIHAAFLTREGFVLVDAAKGEVLNRVPFRSRFEASVNAASPVKIGLDKDPGLFLSACYGTGAIALSGSQKGSKTVWKNDSSLSSHFGTPVFHKGHLFGFHGRQEEGAELRCVDATNGKVLWSEAGLGCGWVILCGEELVVVGEDGTLAIAPATPGGFQPRSKSTPFAGPVRAAPAVDRGVLYVRDGKSLKAIGFGPLK